MVEVNSEYSDNLDVALLARISQGDSQGLAELYDRQSALLYGLVLKILNDAAEAEDILQDVFLQIWDKAPCYDPCLGRPLSWTVTLARNKALDRLRSLQRRREILAVAAEAERDDWKSSGVEVGSREKIDVVRAAIDQLPAEQRLAIDLAFFSGLSHSEIAEKLQIPLGTVKARIRRGMLKLHGTLIDYL